ncbi:MAG TPA: hypothetical protein VFP37_15065 [Steroidobacteraceae bacterium]|nr:hypothetical protein [Steroidobacteraceae bacterium]
MKTYTFVAFLYLIGVGGIGIGLTDLYFKTSRGEYQSGVMTTTDPAVARVAKYAPGDGTYADVTYTTAKAAIQVPHAYLDGKLVQRAAAGEPIPVRFIGDHPKGGLYDDEQPPAWSPGWLIIGVISLAIAVFAHRLLRREARGG